MSGPTETWVQCGNGDLPDRFTDPACAEFRAICSNGWEGGIDIGSAFIHGPQDWPQCFPNGAEGNCSCTVTIVRRVADARAAQP